jgi:hypothetical protein
MSEQTLVTFRRRAQLKVKGNDALDEDRRMNMKRNGIDHFVAQWTKDGSFRAEFRTDAKAAVQKRGIELDAQEWQAVTALGGSEPLSARINPDGGGNGSGAQC